MTKTLTTGDDHLRGIRKALLLMKLSFLLVLAGFFTASAHVNGQNSISVKANGLEITRVLKSIEKQGTYRFLFNSRLKELSDRISLDLNNVPLADALNQILAGKDLSYKLLDNNLIVILSSAPGVQDISITGKITGENGEGLANVTIFVKGTSRGAVTDNSGSFTLTAPETATLVVSYIGYTQQEIAVNNQAVVNVKLVKSSKAMDEVVVVGYGTQRKVDVTGSVVQIKGDEISKQASQNAISGLQGKVAGVNITNSGQPGTAPTIRIRGLGTYYAGSGPLYVVDGVWFDDVQFLNPADIENVNILKDASSEAIYGIRGANGVILITTKKGAKNGKTTVTYNGYAGFQHVTNTPKMADGHEYAILFNELTRANGGTDFLDSSGFGKGTDWYHQTLRDAFVTNHTISASGGSEKNSYNFSVGYLDQDGILKTNNYKRYTARFQNDIIISNHVKVGYTGIGTYSYSTDPPAGIFNGIYNAPPILPVKNTDGSFGNPGTYGLGQSVTNPQATLDFNHAATKTYSFIGSAYIDVNFLKHFIFHSSLGGTYENGESRTYNPVYTATSTQFNALSDLGVNRLETRNWILENTLTYSNTFGDHRVTILAGQNAQYNSYNELHGTATGVPNITTGNWYLGLGTGGVGSINDIDINNADQKYPLLSTIASYFGRINYSFRDKYLINATIRADGSSKFQSGQQWGYFPSIGAAWVISQEAFMQNQHLFNTLKVKGSWGKVGNVSIPNFISTRPSVSGGAYSVIYGNSGVISPGVSVAAPVPPALLWENGIGTDIGLEAAMMNNRLSVDLDFYNKETQRIIFDVNQLGSSGFSTPVLYTNVGNLRNRGVELAVNWKDDASKDFHYSLGGNVAYNENELISDRAGNQKIFSGGSSSTGGAQATVSQVGLPIGVFYGYKVIGIFQSTDEVNAYADKGGALFQPNAKPGDFKYASKSGAGPISDNDRQVLGNPNPKWTYGINTAFTYKAFDLALDFQGVAGVQVYNAQKGLRYGAENWTQDFYNNRWHGAGTSNKYPSVNIGGGDNYKPNSWYVEDGSYFRIRNLQLGYTFPNARMSNLGIQKLRIYANAQNPFNFFKYKGFSPEVGGAPGSAGIDTNVYPLFATYNFGVNLTF